MNLKKELIFLLLIVKERRICKAERKFTTLNWSIMAVRAYSKLMKLV